MVILAQEQASSRYVAFVETDLRGVRRSAEKFHPALAEEGVNLHPAPPAIPTRHLRALLTLPSPSVNHWGFRDVITAETKNAKYRNT
jgi:hypothetical protein